MTYLIGSLVQWTRFSPTRFGYGVSDIGKVVSVRGGKSGREVDVQFSDGDVVRGALEHWFERVHTRSEAAEGAQAIAFAELELA